ncbi:MAG: NAD(P)/FAD-dependent oxidoreductase [Gemmatimonadota bacterium]
MVVGAGAAGMVAALFAARHGGSVLLLERTKDGGRKILISGGGRCNVLPSRLDVSQYFTASSANSLRKMLLSWPLAEQRSFIEKDLGIALALEQETGKLFPVSNKARDVRDALLEAARRAGARVRHNTYVKDLAPGNGHWRVRTEGGETLEAAKVIIATGGLSVPATGSDGTGLRVIEKLGHTIHQTYPALTPLTCEPPRHADLAGVSLEVTLSAPQAKYSTRGGFLFTHRGYSGPTVLNVSHFAITQRAKIEVQWTEHDAAAWDALLKSAKGALGTLLRRELPGRLADALLREADVNADETTSQLKKDARARLVNALTRYELPYTGDEGYRKAEVTGGGVALGAVSPRTLESRIQPGLYLCGEILDAFGPIGGYNFAWAFATGRSAGIASAGN